MIVAGRIITPEDAEAILQAGSADFISLGRALIADPHWCLKAFGQIDAPIRPCISCNVCFERLSLERDVACVQNPLVGTEFESLEALEPQLVPPGARPRKRVLVVGAGVSGVEAARVTAARGHFVEVWEKEAVAGGQMPLAVAAPDKAEVSGVWTYRVDALNRLGVTIRLAAAVTAETIRAFAPHVVLVATGARSRGLPSTLAVGVPVVQAWDVLLHPEVIGSAATVTIIGGGIVGLETADLLTARGCRVTILEMGDRVAAEMARNNRFEVLARLERGQARILTGARVDSVTAGRLVVDRRGEQLVIDPGDVVIAAIGPEPNRDVAAGDRGRRCAVVLVGDCNRPGDFLTAIRDASMAALAVGWYTEVCNHQHNRYQPSVVVSRCDPWRLLVAAGVRRLVGVRRRCASVFVGRLQDWRRPAVDRQHGVGRTSGQNRGGARGPRSQRAASGRRLSSRAGVRGRGVRAADRLRRGRQVDQPGPRAAC